jgi:hypothetical protein
MLENSPFLLVCRQMSSLPADPVAVFVDREEDRRLSGAQVNEAREKLVELWSGCFCGGLGTSGIDL